MKKIKLLFSAAALLAGLLSGIAANISYASGETKHDWMDWNSETILANATQTEAQNLCSTGATVCLRARDNVLIHTTGVLPWQ